MLDAEITRWAPLCGNIVKSYYAPGLDRDDLMQEARIGVMKALRDFRGERGNLGGFIGMCVERQVIAAVKTATRGKHRPLNEAVRVALDGDGEEVDAVEFFSPVDDRDDPLRKLILRDEFAEMATALRERLSDKECACLLRQLNGMTYDEIAADLALTIKSVGLAIDRARWKLTGKAPPSQQHVARARRHGVCGHTCPECGGATVKKRGRGRPPRCVVCRTRPRAMAA